MDYALIDRSSDPDEIAAGLIFVDPKGEPPFLHLAKPSEPDPKRTRGKYDAIEVAVRNGRRFARDASLDREGFLFVRHESGVADFYDDAEIRETYYPEIEALVKGLTGARRVIVFDHTVRGTHAGPRGSVEVELPSDNMHCDFTLPVAQETVRQIVPPDELEERPGARILQLNLWRPIAGPLRTMPLTVCDASTLKPESFVRTPLVRPDFASEFTTLAHDPAQRWYYLPGMTRDEVIVFKNYDSAPSSPCWTMHGAFTDPTAPADAPPRESIEVRVIAVI
jgi:hypothetical protein